MGELKQGSDPHSRAIVCVRGETFKAESETADLWQSLNGMKIRQSFPQPHMLDRDAGSLEDTAAGSWNLGIVEKSQGEGCC